MPKLQRFGASGIALLAETTPTIAFNAEGVFHLKISDRQLANGFFVSGLGTHYEEPWVTLFVFFDQFLNFEAKIATGAGQGTESAQSASE